VAVAVALKAGCRTLWFRDDPDEVDREAAPDIPFNYPDTRVEWEHDMVVRHLRRAGIN